MNPVRCLNPGLADLPVIADDPAVNHEALASLRPDVVLIRLGTCNLPSDDGRVSMTVRVLENLGLPLVVLSGPNYSGQPTVERVSEEVALVGRVFGKEGRALRAARFLESQVERVRRRTTGIPDGGKPTVLVFGLSPSARKRGGAGQVFGLNTMESFFVEDIVNARNACRSGGHFRTVSTEHVLALDPDVIVLCTAAGYHPPRELYTAPYYRNLRPLKAVRNRRVVALPWTPWNCEKRLEYPIDVMVIAKAAYPERFRDINLAEWLISFYRGLYGVDRQTALRLRSCQWMDWVLEENGAR
jgi:iron complex transport system substrate-binding protein